LKNIESSIARMAETVMPHGGGDGKESFLGGAGVCRWDGVEVVVAIAMKHHVSSDILERKTKSVKLYRIVVVVSEWADEKQIMD